MSSVQSDESKEQQKVELGSEDGDEESESSQQGEIKGKVSIEEKNVLNEDDLMCAVCLLILPRNAVTIDPCEHSFCPNCIDGLDKCPMCRGDIEKLNKGQVWNDKNPHPFICVKTKDEGGQVKKEVWSAEKLRKKQEEEAGLSNTQNLTTFKPDLSKVPQKNLQTWKCPVCKYGPLARQSLLDHIVSTHPKAIGVCPICASHSWGDPTYTTHLSGHMKLRHSYDMNDLVDDEEEEDEVMRRVLELSKVVQ